MKLEVLTTVWGADDDVFVGGVHEAVKLTKALARLVAGAEAAGMVVVLEATAAERKLLGRHVQSQEDGEKAYERALENGRWQHGNLLQAIADREARLEDEALSAEDGAALFVELDDLRARFAATEEPT